MANRSFILISGALAIAVPDLASAQFWSQPVSLPSTSGRSVDTSSTPRVGTGREMGDIRRRIDDGRDTGSLSRKDARRLRRENDQIGVLADRYVQDGLSASEAQELDNRAAVLRDQVDAKRMASRKR